MGSRLGKLESQWPSDLEGAGDNEVKPTHDRNFKF
jgi:hypothetical protein